MIIAVDFDGVIVEDKYPDTGKELNRAGEVIRKLYNAGHTIIIWTCRGGWCLIRAKDFLDNNKILYSKINENADFDDIGFKPFPKIYADIYIDDKNFGGFPGWDAIAKELL